VSTNYKLKFIYTPMNTVQKLYLCKHWSSDGAVESLYVLPESYKQPSGLQLPEYEAMEVRDFVYLKDAEII